MYTQVRLYDPGAQRRPVINFEVKDEALTTLALSSRERHMVVGSGRGIMNLIDLRKPGRILNTYKDFVGSITAIACPRSNPFIVSVSLDRYMRIHHLDTKKLLQKVYLTSRLSCMVLRSVFTLNSIDEMNNESKKHHGKQSLEQTNNDDGHRLIDIESNSEAEYDEIFDKMAVIDNKKNETNMVMENKMKRKKIEKLELKDPKTADKFLQGNRKRLKKIRNRAKTTTI